MEEKNPIQKLRQELSKATPSLRSDEVATLYEDYGIMYNIPDVETYRLVALLAAAEKKLLEKSEKEE